MPLSEAPGHDDELPQYALTKSNDLVKIGDAVTEDAVEVTYAGNDESRPTTVPTSALELLPAGTTYMDAVRLKLARAGIPIPSPAE
jgi:hypothetical protein